MIPYGRQDITEDDVEAVVATLKSDFITQGPAIAGFEAAIAEGCGAAGAVAVTSATAGLHVAYLALGLGEGDLLWTVPNTFAATANAALYCGAEVDFVDIDIASRNMDVAALEAKLEAAAKAGRLPKIVAPVHFAGAPCDMAEIAALADRYGFRVVEDASHAVGASHGLGDAAERTGACRYSDAAVFSFHPVKIVTTGEGGAITSADPEIVAKCATLRTHGITRDAAALEREPDGPWYYEMLDLGFNYRMTDIQAALGRSQIGRLDEYVARRGEIAARYAAAFADTGLGLPEMRDDRRSSWHLYSVHWPDGLGGLDRRRAFEAMRERGLGVNVHYIPVHRLPYYERLGFRAGDFPAAEAHYAQTISLPLFPTMSEDDIAVVIDVVRDLATAG
ncbi:MAG: UDP-4-amino-4,6-dideoxy-N-acetyl-beta-L-altrosamine transaminase [Pseudomonadota bacterium]